jgi:hypothetical protein
MAQGQEIYAIDQYEDNSKLQTAGWVRMLLVQFWKCIQNRLGPRII